jgi:hypothetical protein
MPRCTFRGCPVRFRVGDDRPCLDHWADQSDTLTERMSRFTDVMTAAPGEHDGQADGHGPAVVNRHGVTIR